MNKLESEEGIARDIPFDLAKLLNRANNSAQIRAVDKMINYEVDWNQAYLKHQYLVGNPIYLERILMAVADNAVKFTNPGRRA